MARLAAAGGCLMAALLGACAGPPPERQEIVRVEVAPAELAILPVEDRQRHPATQAGALREAIAAAAVERGFSPLGRGYVDRAEIDLDVPALGEAGVLRVRLLDWEPEAGPPARLRGRVHLSLYQQGELLADYQYRVDLRSDSLAMAADSAGQLTALRRRFAAELVGQLPPPPDLDAP